MSALVSLVQPPYLILARPEDRFVEFVGMCAYLHDGKMYAPLCMPNATYARADLDFTNTSKVCRTCKKILQTANGMTQLDVMPDE